MSRRCGGTTIELGFAGPQTFFDSDGPPERSQRRGDRLHDFRDRQAELGEVPAKPFEQHRRHRRIMSRNSAQPSPARECVSSHAPIEGVTVVHVQRNLDIEHAFPAGRVGRLDNVARSTPANGAPSANAQRSDSSAKTSGRSARHRCPAAPVSRHSTPTDVRDHEQRAGPRQT